MKRKAVTTKLALAAAALLIWLASCAPGGPYTITVNVSGLAGTLVLSDGAEEQTISADGSYTFPGKLPAGDYEVRMVTPPVFQNCALSGDRGTLAGDVEVSVSCQDKTWERPADLSDHLPDSQGAYRLALDACGDTAVLAWEALQSGTYHVYYSEWSGSGWGAPLMASNPAVSATRPVVAVGQGYAVVAWLQDDSGVDAVYAMRKGADGWQTPARLSTAGRDTLSVSLAAGGTANKVVASWVEDDGSGTFVTVTRTLGLDSSGWLWSGATTLSSNNSSGPDVAVNSAGNALVAWSESVNVSVSEFAGSWNLTPGTFSGGSSNYAPRVFIDDSGNGWLSWASSSPFSLSNVNLVGYRDGAWGSREVVGGPSANSPALAGNPDGRTLLTWVQSEGGYLQIYAQTYADDAWSRPLPLSPLGGSAGRPHAAAGARGGAAAAWLQDDAGGDDQVFVALWRETGEWVLPEGLDDHLSLADSAVLGATVSGEAGPLLGFLENGLLLAWIQSDSTGDAQVYTAYLH
jgi:hypothetical protein